jgi:hypothetical protein
VVASGQRRERARRHQRDELAGQPPPPPRGKAGRGPRGRRRGLYRHYRHRGGGDVRILRMIPGKPAATAGRSPMNFLLRTKRVRVAYSPDGSRAGPIGAVRFMSESPVAMPPGSVPMDGADSGYDSGGTRRRSAPPSPVPGRES